MSNISKGTVFLEQKTYIYTVFETILKTNQNKTLIRIHTHISDTQIV